MGNGVVLSNYFKIKNDGFFLIGPSFELKLCVFDRCAELCMLQKIWEKQARRINSKSTYRDRKMLIWIKYGNIFNLCDCNFHLSI